MASEKKISTTSDPECLRVDRTFVVAGEGNEAISHTPASIESSYLHGWRLHLTTLSVVLSLLLVNLEVTIVSTSLIAITNDLKGFSKTSWIVTGYLITYTAFMITWAKLSDIFGRKQTVVTAVLIFVAFSAGCGGSKTLDQLIICRTFQGVGGAGTYSLAVLITYEMVPKAKLPLYGGLNAVAVALATLMGPLFGGLINDHASWRWIFYLNLPAGALVIATLLLGMPGKFPYQARASNPQQGEERVFSRASLAKLDILGACLLLIGSLLLTTALLETSTRFSWSSAATICLLILSGLSWICFFVWEWHITGKESKKEPIFPWRFVYDPAWMGMLFITFLVGAPFNAVVVSLPQRSQAVSGASPLNAGIRLLPYTFGAALGAVFGNIIGSKRRVAVVHILFLGALLQLLGLVLLSTLPTTKEFPARGYGFETIAGFGVGVTFGILILATPFVANPGDLAVATGAIVQFRFLGGVIGLSIASSVMNGYIKNGLTNILSADAMAALLQSTETLTRFAPDVQEKVIEVFAKGYNLQYRIVTGFAGAQFLAVIMMWKKGEQIKVG